MLQTSQSDQQDGNGVLTLGGKYVECPMVWWCSCYHLQAYSPGKSQSSMTGLSYFFLCKL